LAKNNLILMASLLTIDKEVIDLNGMFNFNFQYNFEVLKRTFEALLKVQTLQQEKINSLEERFGNKLSE
jgi:hypothetical protein